MVNVEKISSLYRFLIPYSIRRLIYSAFLGDFLFFMRNYKIVVKSKRKYIESIFHELSPEDRAWAFMGKYGVSRYPYRGALKYKGLKTTIFTDCENGLPYVIHNSKKMYFPRTFNSDRITGLYQDLLAEQESDAPHRYIRDFECIKDKVLLDIGAAEGIFTLDCIEYIKKAYLFECEDMWIEALQATFAPWSDKIEIIEKYVSDSDDEKRICIDTFMQGREQINLFIKMDIEGAELSALKGGENLLQKSDNIYLSICTYHRIEDAKEIALFLKGLDYICHYTDGYFFLNGNMNKAICRAYKDVLKNKFL